MIAIKTPTDEPRTASEPLNDAERAYLADLARRCPDCGGACYLYSRISDPTPCATCRGTGVR